jgi:hypothetical protein
MERKGLDAELSEPAERATRSERIKHGAAVCRSTLDPLRARRVT